MKRTAAVLVTATALMVGCFPILLDVKDGQVLIPRQEGVFSFDLESGKTVRVAERGKGDPAWACWSPDGTKVLVADVGENNKTALRIVDVKTHKASPLAQLEATACVLWAPDSNSVSAAVVSMTGTQLKLIRLEDGQTKVLLDQALVMHAWLPDGKVVAFRVTKKEENSQVVRGELVVVDPAGGEPRVVTAATCAQSAILSASPDGKQVLVVETEVTGEGDEEQETSKLVRITLADGAKQTLPATDPVAAFWSPDGRRILILNGSSGAGMEAMASNMMETMGSIVGAPIAAEGPQLVVTDAEGKNAVLVAANVMTQSGGMGGPAMYPCWADNDTILYFVSAKTYGKADTAVRLMSVKADGSSRKDLQAAIDNGVAQAAASPAPVAPAPAIE